MGQALTPTKEALDKHYPTRVRYVWPAHFAFAAINAAISSLMCVVVDLTQGAVC